MHIFAMAIGSGPRPAGSRRLPVCRMACAGTNGAVGLAAEPETWRGVTRVVPAATDVLAFRGDPRFSGIVTPEPPGARVAAGVAVPLDTVSQAWVARLGCPGPERDAAAAELHGLLLRAARFEIARRRTAFSHLGGADLDDLAWQSADDALRAKQRRCRYRVRLLITGPRRRSSARTASPPSYPANAPPRPHLRCCPG
jgi:hypothetical protein